MNESQELGVRLVGPEVWKDRIADALKPLNGPSDDPERLRRCAQAILESLHNRHVGITPGLAADLARALLERELAPKGTWGCVFTRLIRELSTTGETPHKPGVPEARQPFGLLLNVTPIFVIVRVAAPVVQEACRRMGACYLFSKDDLGAQVGAAEYQEYEQKLCSKIEAMANQREEEGISGRALLLFWQELALTLHSLSRPYLPRTQSDSVLPEADPVGLALLMELEPELAPTEQRPRQVRRLPVSAQRQLSRRPREGGIVGIHMTRRLEEVDNMLLSELLNPPVLRADRLLNTGFLAFEREPQRERQRDVLIAAVMPGELRERVGAQLVKACWFDSLARLSDLLRQYQLHRSEFRWIEGDLDGCARSGLYALQDMPEGVSLRGEDSLPRFRHTFMMALHWLPSFLDTQELFARVDERTENDGGPSESQVSGDRISFAWETAAWREQRERVRTQPGDGRAPALGRPVDGKLRWDEFAVVHVMSFLPAGLYPAEDKIGGEGVVSLLARLRQDLRLGALPGRSVSITWVPEEGHASGWRFSVVGRLQESLFPSDGAEHERKQATVNGVAGRLVKTWLDHWIQEIWYA